MLYLLNALPLGACPKSCTLKVEETTPGQVVADIARSPRLVNAIGHPSFDAVVRAQLGVHLPQGERFTVALWEGDQAIVAQYIGPRLPEGATELPEGARIEFRKVSVED